MLLLQFVHFHISILIIADFVTLHSIFAFEEFELDILMVNRIETQVQIGFYILLLTDVLFNVFPLIQSLFSSDYLFYKMLRLKKQRKLFNSKLATFNCLITIDHTKSEYGVPNIVK